jgi:hypothetical protein
VRVTVRGNALISFSAASLGRNQPAGANKGAKRPRSARLLLIPIVFGVENGFCRALSQRPRAEEWNKCIYMNRLRARERESLYRAARCVPRREKNPQRQSDTGENRIVPLRVDNCARPARVIKSRLIIRPFLGHFLCRRRRRRATHTLGARAGEINAKLPPRDGESEK